MRIGGLSPHISVQLNDPDFLNSLAKPNMTHKQIFFLITFLLIGGGVWGQATLPVYRSIWSGSEPTGWDKNGTDTYGTDCSGSNGSSSCKLDDSGDWVSVNFNDTPGQLNFYLKGEGLSGSYVFKIQQSIDGISWANLETFNSGNTISSSCTYKSYILLTTTRFVRWFYETKDLGNIRVDEVNILVGCTPPTTQATNFGITNIDPTQMSISWTRGNGANILVVARQGGAVDADPVNSTTYTANGAFGSGDEIGTGNYVVYNGTGTSATITALTANTTYHYALYEFDGMAGSECYRTSDKLTGSASTAPVNDDCTGATVLTVDTDLTCDAATSGSSINATESISAITCAGFAGDADDDVWYSFVATNSTHIITVDGAANMDAVIDLRSGACNGTNIDCSDATTADGIEVITATGLTPAATYYVRVYDYDAGGGDFTICITTPPSPLHYRSKATGNFSTAKTWETSPNNSDPWVAASKGPDEDDLSITIRVGHTVTVATSVTVDQLTVASGSTLNITGGTLSIADGTGDDLTVAGTLINGSSIASSGSIVITSTGKYQHNVSGSNGTIPNCTWNSGSTCEILQSGGTGRPDGLGQSFHHFTWNFSGQSGAINLMVISTISPVIFM